MTTQTNENTTTPLGNQQPTKAPDDVSGLDIEAKFRIFDPITGKTIAEGKA